MLTINRVHNDLIVVRIGVYEAQKFVFYHGIY